MTDLLARAARLPVYRALWGGRTPRFLRDAPLLSAWTWRAHVHRAPARCVAERPALWTLHEVPGDDPVWVAYAAADVVAEAASAVAAFRRAGVRDGDRALVVAPPGPWAWNAVPYLLSGLESVVADRIRCEVFALSMVTVSFKPELAIFPIEQRPSVLVAPAADVARLVELAPGLRALPLRLALVAGPAAQIAWPTVGLLHLPGCLAPFAGEPGEEGLRLDPDRVTAELVPDEEWARAIQFPGRTPEAVALADAVGLSGELVVTVANRALPLVRFRTQERVRVRGAAGGPRVERLTVPRAHPDQAGALAVPRAAR